MSIKSLFSQVARTSTAYKAEFMLDSGEFKTLCTIRTLTTEQLAAIAAIKSGNCKRTDVSTVICAMRMYSRIIAPSGTIKSYSNASI